MIKETLQLLLFILPWRIRRYFLGWLIGVKISKNSYIGLSIVSASEITFGDNIYVGNFNYIGRLKVLKLCDGCRVKSFNWISGAWLGTFVLKKNSALQRLSYYDCSGSIFIGENTIIAGRGSQFYTHGVTPDDLDQFASIVIGDFCYVGSRCCFVPGSVVKNNCFIAMNSTVTRTAHEECVLYAGSPARVVKKFTGNEKYFVTTRIHPHHNVGKIK